MTFALVLLALVAPPDTLRPGDVAFAVAPGQRQFTYTVITGLQARPLGSVTETVTVRGDTVTSVRRYAVQNGVTTDSSVAVLPDLRPVAHRWTRRGPASAGATLRAETFAEGRAETHAGWAGGRTRDSTVTLAAPVFGDGWTEAILQALPLADGYEVVFETLDAEHGRVPRTVRVRGTETVQTPAGTADAWAVDVEARGRPTRYLVDRQTRAVLLVRIGSDREDVYAEITPAE